MESPQDDRDMHNTNLVIHTRESVCSSTLIRLQAGDIPVNDFVTINVQVLDLNLRVHPVVVCEKKLL